ncbi:MAG: hypothetical protein ABSG84_10135 [Acidobacteriaceae bacterium]|jgi:hypothetical protein
MNQLHAVRAQLRQIGRCAFVGTLVGLMAAQAVGQSAPTPTLQPSAQTDVVTLPSSAPAPAAASEAAPALPHTLSSSTTPDPAVLPNAPSAVQTASLTVPSNLNLMLANSRQASQALQTTSSTPSEHKVKAGWLVLGVVGAVAAGMGAYVYSIKTTDTRGKMVLGTMFMAPGATAAGFGFYFAFHQKN